MPVSISLFGLTFHLYGFLIGVAVVTAASLAEKVFVKETASTKFWSIAAWVIAAGLIGGRAWHVVTDWFFYQTDLLAMLFVWRGGMSILGAVAGGLLGAWIMTKQFAKQFSYFQLTDAVVLGLPFGQAIGRLGNWANQELYGLPTELPWKIYIDPAHRVVDYEQYSYFQPLFAYESLFLLGLGAVLWFGYRQKKWTVGSGRLTLIYLISYSWGRFLLEFIRIDKAVVAGTGWGVNQLVLAAVVIGLSLVMFITEKRKRNVE